MNLLLVEDGEIHDGRVRLDGRRAEHLLRILRVEAGSTVRVGRIGGSLGTARVHAVATDTVDLEVEIPDRPARRPAIDLIVGLPRPQALKRMLQYAATLRVGGLELIGAWKVEKSFFQSPVLEPASIGRHLLLGAEQGGHTWLPEVRIERRFVACLRRLEETPATALRLIAHPEAGDPIESVAPAFGDGRALQIALGPEGGWIDREVESFQQAGFRPVCLGPWILRVETALVAILAQLDLLRRACGDAKEPAC